MEAIPAHSHVSYLVHRRHTRNVWLAYICIGILGNGAIWIYLIVPLLPSNVNPEYSCDCIRLALLEEWLGLSTHLVTWHATVFLLNGIGFESKYYCFWLSQNHCRTRLHFASSYVNPDRSIWRKARRTEPGTLRAFAVYASCVSITFYISTRSFIFRGDECLRKNFLVRVKWSAKSRKHSTCGWARGGPLTPSFAGFSPTVGSCHSYIHPVHLSKAQEILIGWWCKKK